MVCTTRSNRLLGSCDAKSQARASKESRRVLVKSQSRALCRTSRLGGMTRDMQTPDPPVEPMGVLQRNAMETKRHKCRQKAVQSL